MALTKFNRFVYLAKTEVEKQQVDIFNTATRGGMVLTAGGTNQGDYDDKITYAKISGVVRRRNAAGSGTVVAKDLTQLTATSVKVASAAGPFNIDPGLWSWIQRSPEEAGAMIGQQMAVGSLQDKVTAAIKSYCAATLIQTAVVYDYSATGTVGLNQLVTAAGKFGDRASDIICWVMHSKVYTDILGGAVTNSNTLFNFGNINVVQDGFGRPMIVTDATDLVYTDGGTRYRTIGLVAGGIVCEENNDYIENVETANGDENILRTFQAEWSFNLGLKGYAWDKSNGGASPTDAALATGTNWDKIATDNKDLAGVLIKSQ
jgi:hypothetical protein